MPQKVVYIPQVGEVLLRKNTRSRRIKLYVRPNRQVIVSLPYLVRYKEAERFAAKHIPWILKQQLKFNNLLPTFEPGSVYRTKSHQVKITEKDCEKITMRTNGGEVTIYIPVGTDVSSKPVLLFIDHVFTEVYRREAKQYLPGRTAELAEQFGFKFSRVSVRNNRSNWGSCSGKNNLSLNLNLMKLPNHLVDYIILHELSHTVVKNHSEKFYAVLNKVTGGKARELSKEIKGYSTYGY
jgi:predicted metal-dependent hydrolase